MLWSLDAIFTVVCGVDCLRKKSSCLAKVNRSTSQTSAHLGLFYSPRTWVPWVTVSNDELCSLKALCNTAEAWPKLDHATAQWSQAQQQRKEPKLSQSPDLNPVEILQHKCLQASVNLGNTLKKSGLKPQPQQRLIKSAASGCYIWFYKLLNPGL